MFTCTHIDHVGINTNDMEATLQLWCAGYAVSTHHAYGRWTPTLQHRLWNTLCRFDKSNGTHVLKQPDVRGGGSKKG